MFVRDFSAGPADLSPEVTDLAVCKIAIAVTTSKQDDVYRIAASKGASNPA
jgi:hypothetical protein